MTIEVTIRDGNIAMTGRYTVDAFEKYPNRVLEDIMKGIKAVRSEAEEIVKIDNSGMDNFVMPV